MDLFNTIENKVRFYGKKIDLMWKKHKVILRICLRGFAFYTFLLSVLLCAVLSLPISDGILNVLFEATRNICYSYIAGYIFYILSDVYPKALNKIIGIKDVITYEICILHNANSVLDTTVKFSRSPNNETDRIKKFIVNSSKINPYTSDEKRIELNDIFLQYLSLIQNECRNPFYLLLKYKDHLLEHEEVRILLELKDFIFLNDFYNKRNMYLLGFEWECYDYISNIHKLEELIKMQMKSYVYNPCDYERLEKELKKSDGFIYQI